MEQVLVTGAAGFIGSHLCERLVATGRRVIGVDSFADNYDAAVKRRNIEKLLHTPDQFQLIEADIRDAAAMRSAMPDSGGAIMHLAALAGVRPSVEQPARYMDVNVHGTAVLMQAAVDAGVRRFIFGSSSSVYGNNAKIPFAEDDRVDEPVSPYAASKKAGELLAHTFHAVHGLDVTCLRFFTVFGPRQRPDLAIHKFMRLISEGKPIPMFGDGSMQRDFTFVSDIVGGVVTAIERCNGYHIYNLGSDRPVRLDDLIRAIEKTIGREAKIERHPAPAGDVRATWADLTRSKAELDYQSHVSLEEGLRQQWTWMVGSAPRTTV